LSVTTAATLGLYGWLARSRDQDELSTDVTALADAVRLGSALEAGYWPPDGLEYHVCLVNNSQLRVSEIWSSNEF
jgi:hypothetical protein